MSFNNLSHLVIPHPQTHQKAHLLSFKALFIYLFLFIFLQYGLSFISFAKPDVLGVSTNISIEKVIVETNKKRVEAGLQPVKENSLLDKAAQLKAENMFAENYWAHFSPSGKDPWGFMNQAGYKFSYAGENLAKNFQTSEDVVIAWMNSPSHKENLMNPNYQDIGIAVVNGTLQGQETTLVVQMFGKPSKVVAVVPKNAEPETIQPEVQPININEEQNLAPESQQLAQNEIPVNQPVGQVQNASTIPNLNSSKFMVDPYAVTRVFGIGLFALIGFLLIVDFYELRRRGVLRISSHHFAHMGLLMVSSSAILSTKVGQITELAQNIVR